MMKDELEYLKYIMRDVFGKESSKVTELILLHGNCLTIGEIINLYQSEFRIVRNVLLTLLIYNILDFHIIYDNKRECVHSNEETKMQTYDMKDTHMKRDKHKGDYKKKKSKNMWGRYGKDKETVEENEEGHGGRNVEDEEEEEEEEDEEEEEEAEEDEEEEEEEEVVVVEEEEEEEEEEVVVVEEEEEEEEEEVVVVEEEEEEEENNIGTRSFITSEIENDMETVMPLFDNYKYIDDCHCEMCICKIKRVEYSVIVPNIYILIRYPSILYLIHPTVIIKKKNTAGIREYNANISPESNSKSIKNENVIDSFRRADNCPKLYNFFFTESEKNVVNKKENEITEENKTQGLRSFLIEKEDGEEKGKKVKNEESGKKEVLFEDDNLLSFIEKVIIIRIAKRGRLTINECLKDFQNDDYIKLCSKKIPNISRRKLKQIFLNLLHKNFIKKCKYFNEHFCRHRKFLCEEQKKKHNPTDTTAASIFEMDSQGINGTLKCDEANDYNNMVPLNLQKNDNEAINDKDDKGVQKKSKMVSRPKKWKNRKVIEEEDTGENQIHGNHIDNIDNIDNINACGRSKTGKRNINRIRNINAKKKKKNVYNSEEQNEEKVEEASEEDIIESNVEKNKEMNENIFTLLNMDLTRNSPKMDSSNTKVSETKISTNVHFYNAHDVQSDTIDCLDNPHTYFQVNNHMLSFLYLKQLCFDFISTLFRFNEVTKCIFFYLMKKVYVRTDPNMNKYDKTNNTGDDNIGVYASSGNTNMGESTYTNFNTNINFDFKEDPFHVTQFNTAFVMFDEIEEYVCKTLRNIKIDVNKNIVLQNLNGLLKNSDSLIKIQQGEKVRYSVDFSNVLNLYKRKMLHKLLKKIIGQEGLRVWSFLTFYVEEKCNDDKCNDETISEKVLIPVNDVRKTLYNLLNMGFIKCHEWSSGNTATTATTATTASMNTTSASNIIMGSTSSSISTSLTTNNIASNNNTTNMSGISSGNAGHAKSYGKHALLFSSNPFLTHNKIKEHLFVIAQKIFIRKYFENKEINNLYNKSFVSGNDCDAFLNNETNSDVNFNHNLNGNSRNMSIRQGANTNTNNNFIQSVFNNSNKIKNNKRNSLAALEYAMDYLEISLIKLDRLIFLFNS